MEQVLLIRYAEIHLKGLNRPYFEKVLMSNIKRALYGLSFKVIRAQSRIFIEGLPSVDMPEAIDRLRLVYGVHSVSPALMMDVDFKLIEQAVYSLVESAIAENTCEQTFKVLARRADKRFPMNSDQINRELGGLLLDRFDCLKVDVHNPQIKVGVEVREKALVYVKEIPCAGGMPVGSNGRAALLLSGGIDSAVAGAMIAKRGVSLSCVHFYSYPYTSERARDKVIELARILTKRTFDIKLHLVPFTAIQTQIHEKCPKSHTTLLMRRLMMRISERIAIEDGALALVTGESLGQVASQTMESLAVTGDAVSMSILRPLIGFDKQEIVERAVSIGTYDTSILPYEDCCTVFVPKHPCTKPKLETLRESEAIVNFAELIDEALDAREIMNIEYEYRP